jgi:putative transposase
VEQAEHYQWSSARARLGLAGNGFLDLSAWRAEHTQERWKQVLAFGVDEEAFGQRLQEASRRGRPLGDTEFIQDLERRAGRGLRPSPVGRPRKNPGKNPGQYTQTLFPASEP